MPMVTAKAHLAGGCNACCNSKRVLFRRCFQPQVSKRVSTETCQNLTFGTVRKDAVRGLVRTESGV